MFKFWTHLFYPFYLLQQENYHLGRYLKLLTSGNFWLQYFSYKNLRQSIVWTKKTKLLFALFVCLYIFIFYYTYKLFYTLGFTTNFFLPLFVASHFLLFYLLQPWLWLVVVSLIFPLDRFLKRRLIQQAQKKLSTWRQTSTQNSNSDLLNSVLNKSKIVLAIAGSYGKTTLKETLYTVLSQKYQVLSTVETQNTPLGISKLLLERLEPQTEVLILEFGEHEVGDIRQLCQFFQPDIGIITGINQAHQERMGNLQQAINCIFELAAFVPILVLNLDDNNVKENYSKFIQANQLVFYYSRYNTQEPPWTTFTLQTTGENKYIYQPLLEKASFETENLAWKFDVRFQGPHSSKILSNCRIHLLGEYALGNAIAAFLVGQMLNLRLLEIQEGLAKVWPVKHRLQPIYNHQSQVLVIDDSYNGNPEGVKEAINVLLRFRS